MSSLFTKNGISYTVNDDGMLEGIRLPDTFGNVNLIRKPMSLKVTMTNGQILTTTLNGKKPEVWTTADGITMLEFSDLSLKDQKNTSVPGFRMTLRYEFFEEGTVFTDAFLLGEQSEKIPVTGLELAIPLDLSAFETIRWSLTYRPKKIDGALIQTSAPERNMEPGKDMVFEHSIFPLAGFNLWSKEGPSCYAEFLMEGDNVLAGDPASNRSSVTWENGSPVLYWNFQTTPVLPAAGPWQWRNRWGWVIAPASQKRHYPPLSMYHYFDNYNRYPSDEALEAIAAAGTEVLILHENWRTDVQNGGFPYDPVRFRQVIDFAHRHDIRIMVYIRGNEDSIIEECADWFSHYLKKDYDGLYMDYGGPFHNQTPPDESFQGGRIHFRKHFMENRMRRSYVGKDGLFYSHTGPMFSALGMTGGNIDGYVSGEGERGLLVRSRLDHSYFSMASVCAGTMWTAAFPEYSSPVMAPYLASAGQTPHVPLGTQFHSSSLSHPPVPGIGDVNFRPVWKLWHLMHGTSDLKVLNDYNCRGIFPRSEGISHYMMIAKDRAVCIFANLSGKAVCADLSVDLKEAGIPADWEKYLCFPQIQTPGRAFPCPGSMKLTVSPNDVWAIAFGNVDTAEYEKPYPDLSPLGRKYLEYAEEQRELRKGKGPAKDYLLRLRIQDLPGPYEESMTVDLYDNRQELSEIVNGEYRKIGYIGKNGFQKEETKKEEFLVNGQQTSWFSLREVLGPGKHDLAIRSLHRGDLYYVNTPFYSFIEADVADQNGKFLYCIKFLNELEADRSYLHFTLEFAE